MADTYMIGPDTKKITVADLMERLHNCDPQKVIEVSQCCDNQYWWDGAVGIDDSGETVKIF